MTRSQDEPFQWYRDDSSPNDAVYLRSGPRFFLNSARPTKALVALRILLMHHCSCHTGDIALVQDGIELCDERYSHRQAG